MAELFVTKIIDRLGDISLQKLEDSLNLLMGVEEEVRNLSRNFKNLERVLHDAERRRLKEEGIGVWLEELEDIVYEMEDVLDEWNIKILKPKDLDQGAETKTGKMATLVKKVRSFIPSLFSCLKEVRVRSVIAVKIKEINGRLDSTLRDASQFNLVTGHLDSKESERTGHLDSKESGRSTTSIFDESKFYGRDSEKESLLKLLMPANSCRGNGKEVEKDGVKVISIVGVGGCGKTTMAQMLFNDGRIQTNFELRKWVCISDTFDKKRIANALLESQEKSFRTLELESLLQHLKSSFSEKKFLLVFDDTWNEKCSEWEPLRDALKDGAPGSVILVTTRNEEVARAVGTDHTHTLAQLSHSDCWLILKSIALSYRSELCVRVQEVGQKIAEKCKGLPLAAKVMGSLLLSKNNVQEWQDVLDSEIWQLERATVDLFPVFYLSYKELSPQLKRCFTYCAVFPKDHIIVVEELIRLWMAQGYLSIPSRRGSEKMEKKGYEFFNNLAMRSFFQELKTWDFDKSVIVSCKMHDMVHDFAQFLTKNECRVIDEVDWEKKKTNEGYLYKEKTRHVRWLGKTELINSSTIDIGSARSFFISNGGVSKDLFSYLKSVRSLKLRECNLQEVPQEIGKLIHLRHLDLCLNPLKELPETIGDLYYLETLDLTDCNELQRLPERIADLVHFRHLLVGYMDDLEKMPQRLDKLTSLYTLRKFIAGGAPSNDFAKLRSLNQLVELGIVVDGNADFGKAEMGNKMCLQLLGIEFKGEDVDAETASSIEAMEPPPNLRILHFRNYPRPQLPKWIVAQSLIRNLTALTLVNLRNISSLPDLWKLSSLEFLNLGHIPSLKHLGRSFYGVPDQTTHVRKENVNDDGQAQGHRDVQLVAFCNLRKLEFWYMDNWETWEDLKGEDYGENSAISVMPRLQELNLFLCVRLHALPHRLLRKTTLLKQVQVMLSSKLEERYADETTNDWMEISHIPRVLF